MILHLDDTRHVSVETHSGKIWLRSFNGCGTINPLTKAQAVRIRTALLLAIRETD